MGIIIILLALMVAGYLRLGIYFAQGQGRLIDQGIIVFTWPVIVWVVLRRLTDKDREKRKVGAM